MISVVESEIKFLVNEDDALRFINANRITSNGVKMIAYYDDAAGVLAKKRATYRRYFSKNVLLDEIKTVDSWSLTNRVCLERRAPAVHQDQDLLRQTLSESDVDVSIVHAVKDLTSDTDFVLHLKDTLTVNRHLIAVDSFRDMFDVDLCESDSGIKFCEIEFESHDHDQLRSASEYITRFCQTATKSDMTKRERVRIKR